MRRWGHFVFRHRRLVLAAGVILLGASVVGLMNGGQLKNASDFNVEAVRADTLESDQLPTTGASYGLIFTSAALRYPDPALQSAVTAALEPLTHDRRVISVQTPFNTPNATALVSDDGHSVLANVGLNIDFATARQQFDQLRAEVHPGALAMVPIGEVAIAHDYDSLLAADLRRAEVISLPLALLLLLIVFGTGVAALLCLGVGIFAVLGCWRAVSTCRRTRSTW